MSLRAVRCIAAVLAVVLTAGCGSTFEELRPTEPAPRPRAASDPVFLPAKPRANPGPDVSDAEVGDALRWALLEVRLEALRAEWRRIVSEPRFRPWRAEGPRRGYRLMLASWSPRDSSLQAITQGYGDWCQSQTRPGACITLPFGRATLNEAEVYEIAFDFSMGARWGGFAQEMKATFNPAMLRMVLLTGLVVFMACLAIPELTTKIPVAIATAVLTAYLGAQAVYNLVFGWIRMVREVDVATTFAEVRAAGERYGELIGAQTARILVMVAMTAVAEGGVIARLMKLPQAEAASEALAKDTGGVSLVSTGQIRAAKVVQGGVLITAEGVVATDVAMAARGEVPRIRTTVPPKPPQEPVEIKLKYREDWTKQQRADAREKVRRLNEAEDKRVVKSPARDKRSASAKFRDDGNEIPPGCDVDHCVDLQLNGKDTLSNMWPLDSSVNRSLGAQIHHAIKDLPAGTRIGRITIE